MGVPVTRRQAGPQQGFGSSEMRFVTKNFDLDGSTGPTRTQRIVPGAGAYEAPSTFNSVRNDANKLDSYEHFSMRQTGGFNPEVAFDPRASSERKAEQLRERHERLLYTKSMPLKTQFYRHETSWGSLNFSPKWEVRRPSPLIPYTQMIGSPLSHLPPQGSNLVYNYSPSSKLGRFSQKAMLAAQRERQSHKSPPKCKSPVGPILGSIHIHNKHHLVESPHKKAPLNSLVVEDGSPCKSLPRIADALGADVAAEAPEEEEMPSVEFPQVEWPQARGMTAAISEATKRQSIEMKKVAEVAAWHPNPIPKKW
eukprot:CAMPEP_0196585298 /NCGR_PEP_ID=MMETSP1081-20130531/50149_1 /TAXON_ID=36882 /ORGANISM="Pyramimonas amylifera, Strain CCMP720" /LENGTH=309 /DNA_ID=CAMNT_0041906795 /DNA_START=12 /DNA_END=938 /DNA_ORIENTATION=-